MYIDTHVRTKQCMHFFLNLTCKLHIFEYILFFLLRMNQKKQMKPSNKSLSIGKAGLVWNRKIKLTLIHIQILTKQKQHES